MRDARGAAALLGAIDGKVVGRRREAELLAAAVGAGRHVLLEGPPGTGKSTLLRAVAEGLGVGFRFVEGNAELTPARLVGHFDPARVLAEGYDPAVFVDGPLLSALRDGALLYVEEINRIPEETLNVLITVMSEGAIEVPRLGTVAAADGFRMVAAMNPFDAVGTARISGAIYDRVCRISMGYQSAEEEQAIVSAEVPAASEQWIGGVTDLVRRTRTHSDLRVGSSVRGAIDMVRVAESLGELRGAAATDDGVSRDAALVALSGRVRVREGCQRTSEEVVLEIWEDVFGTRAGDGAEGKGGAPRGADSSR